MVIVKSYYHHFSFQEDDLYKFFFNWRLRASFFLLINYFMLLYKLAVVGKDGLTCKLLIKKGVRKYRQNNTDNRSNLYAISHY